MSIIPPILAGCPDTGRSQDCQDCRTTRPSRCSGSGINPKALTLANLIYILTMNLPSAANTWCSKYRNKSLEKRIKTGAHSPGMFRVQVISMSRHGRNITTITCSFSGTLLKQPRFCEGLRVSAWHCYEPCQEVQSLVNLSQIGHADLLLTSITDPKCPRLDSREERSQYLA